MTFKEGFTPQPMSTADKMVLAIQLALGHILAEIGQVDEKLKDAIKRGFDNASLDAERMALRGSDERRTETANSMLAILEELRTITFPEKSQPKHGV